MVCLALGSPVSVPLYLGGSGTCLDSAAGRNRMSQLDRNNLLRFQKADVALLMQQVVAKCTSVLLILGLTGSEGE